MSQIDNNALRVFNNTDKPITLEVTAWRMDEAPGALVDKSGKPAVSSDSPELGLYQAAVGVLWDHVRAQYEEPAAQTGASG